MYIIRSDWEELEIPHLRPGLNMLSTAAKQVLWWLSVNHEVHDMREATTVSGQQDVRTTSKVAVRPENIH